MNKEEMIEQIAQDIGCQQIIASRIVDCLLKTIASELAAGNRVSFYGFGVFEAKLRQARTARNFQNNTLVTIPSRNVPVFTPGIRLKEAVNRVDRPAFLNKYTF